MTENRSIIIISNTRGYAPYEELPCKGETYKFKG